MAENEILAELRRIRAEILDEFNGDFELYCDYLRAVAEEKQRRGVRYAPPPRRRREMVEHDAA